jgi:CHAP domain
VAESTVADVLRVARSQLNYRECTGDACDGQHRGRNHTKYGVAAGWNGVSWCAQFAWWTWRQAGHDVLPKTASVWEMWDYAQRRGWVTDQPTVGAIPVYDFPLGTKWDHIGACVTRLDGPHAFYAIEGNTSPDDKGSQSNGGGVFERHRVLHLVLGFITPPLATPEADMPLSQDDLAAIRALVREEIRATVPAAVWASGWPAPTAEDPKRVELAQDRLVQAARGGGLGPALDTILGAVRQAADTQAIAAAVAARIPAGGASAASIADEIAKRLKD